MSRALYQDLYLDEKQIEIVKEYLRFVDFHLEGGTPEQFEINRRARYLGYMFQKEDLEAYAVGLKSTTPGLEGHNTFIRMSRSQLLGQEDALVLPVNEPVLAREALTLNRFYEQEHVRRSGVDTYAGDQGAPGADFDLTLLEEQLRDIIAFHNGEPVPGNQEILDLKVFWGTLLAGRYPRLKYLDQAGRLSPSQKTRLEKLEIAINSSADTLRGLELPTLDTLEQTPVRDG